VSARQLGKYLVLGALAGAFFLLPPPAHAQVAINEILANPVNEDDEFIELYNTGDQAVDITGYKVSDLVKTYTLPEATISAKSFC